MEPPILKLTLSDEDREAIENTIRGAMLPVATGGFAAIEVHAPSAAEAIIARLERPVSLA